MQVASIILIFLGIFAKFGSLLITLPMPVMGGVFCVMFGMITAVGITNLKFVDLNSPRYVLTRLFCFTLNYIDAGLLELCTLPFVPPI